MHSVVYGAITVLAGERRAIKSQVFALKNDLSSRPAPSLYHHSVVGPRLRQHRYFRGFGSFVGPAVFAALLQSTVYVVVLTRANRFDWHNIGITAAVISVVPFLAAAFLTAFRRNEAPIATAVIVGLAVYSVAISVLSALRVPVSYSGLLLCAPITAALIAYGNITFNRFKDSAHIVLAPFPGVDRVSQELGGIPVLMGPDAAFGPTETLLIDPVYHHSEAWSPLLARCYLEGIEIVPWTRHAEFRFGRLDIESFDVSHLVYSPSQFLYARTKRFFDVSFVLLTLPITLAIGAFVGLYILLRDGGPVIFVQVRRGYGGQRFRMYKFRTMYRQRSAKSTGWNEKRIIPGGRPIRKYRLDEIPQLLNVLLGDMSLIGPRPVAEYVARSTERTYPKYSLRTLVLPGVTGWAQVSSGYAETTTQELEKLSYDLYYIKHMSFDLDLLVLFKTFRTVILGAGGR